MGKYLAFLMCFMLWVINYVEAQERDLQDKAYRQLGYATKHAAHDAALHIDLEALVQSNTVDFMELEAETAFADSLKRNLPVDDSFNPLHDFYFVDQIKIVSIEFIDNNFIDSATGLNISFPYIYRYTDHVTGNTNERVIFGPSVVAVVETTILGKDNKTREIVIQEYKY